jgi:hypothetical protein
VTVREAKEKRKSFFIISFIVNIYIIARRDNGSRLYKGPFGRLAGGLQYSFTQKFGFAGFGGPESRLAFAGSPERNANTFLTSLRYYPF